MERGDRAGTATGKSRRHNSASRGRCLAGSNIAGIEFTAYFTANSIDRYVGLHGFPRYTGDLDVFIALSPANAAKILQVFAEFGFGDLGLTPEDFLEPDMVVQIGREPLKIQILTGTDGVTFDQCYAGRTMLSQGALKIPFIGFEQLLQNKAASPRGKDKIDLEELLKAKRSGENSAT